MDNKSVVLPITTTQRSCDCFPIKQAYRMSGFSWFQIMAPLHQNMGGGEDVRRTCFLIIYKEITVKIFFEFV